MNETCQADKTDATAGLGRVPTESRLPSPGLAPKKGRKRGRPKSTRPVVSSPRNGPNLYSIISRASDLSLQQAVTRPSQTGMAPTDVFSGGAGVRPEGDSYAWMSEHRGKRRKSPTLTSALLQAAVPSYSASSLLSTSSNAPSTGSPLIDSLTADPALMVSLGMRPRDGHPMGFNPNDGHLVGFNPNDGHPMEFSSNDGHLVGFNANDGSSPLSVATDATFSPPDSPKLSIMQLKRPANTSTKSPLSAIIAAKSPSHSPSEVYMNELFQELLQDHPE